MASITQTIPSYALGISQQSDEAKLPGQVRDAVNVVPDLVEGLYKRPGAKYVTTATSLNTVAKWFGYFRDDGEGSYIGRVNRLGNVRVWNAKTGAEMTVTGTSNPHTYLNHTKDSDISFQTIGDTTFICNSDVNNSQTATKMKLTDLAPSKPDPYSVYVELKSVSPKRSYALNLVSDATTATRHTATTVRILPPFDTQTDEGCIYSGTKIHVDPTTGIAVRVVVTGQPYVSGYDTNPADRPQYSCQYTSLVELLHGGSYDNSVGPLAGNTNPAFTVSIKNQSYSIFVTNEVTANEPGNMGRIRPVPVDLENNANLSPAAILQSIADELPSGFAYKFIGNGIYITHPTSPFNVEALDGDLFNIVRDTVNTVADLPTVCKHGYIVNVINSEDTVTDDYYLKFVGENNIDGEGHWEECPKPGQKTKIDETRMPYVLKRVSSTAFSIGPYDWADKEVGDENTNRNPSFMSILDANGDIEEARRITKVLFHRNRLVMLSGSNIILSQPDDLGNFWNKTALTFSGKDRIDLSVTKTTPAALTEGIEMNTGLVLFSQGAQFLFTTDSDILNPETAKVYSLSTFNYDPNTNPISLGTTLGFVDVNGAHTRFYEMTDIRRDGEPIVIDQSKVAPRLLAQGIDMIAASRENSHLFFGKKGTDTVYGFKYFNAGDKRLQGSWFRWTFPDDIVFHYVENNRYYLVFEDGTISFIPLNDTIQHTPNIVNADDEDYNIHLDNHSIVTTGSLTYNSSTNTTTFSYPSRFTAGRTAAIVTDTNNNRGRYQIIQGSPGGTGSLTGDWTDSSILIGDLYEMKVEFPTIYPTSSKGQRVVADTKASVTIQRINLNFGDVGEFKTTLSRKGKPDYTDTHESSILDGYLANRAPYVEESFRTIPVYERNTNVNVTLISDHPSPTTLQSMSWEGDYNPRYYKRI